MPQQIQSIRAQLEKQALQQNPKPLQQKKQQKEIEKKDSLRLGWRDVVIF